MEIQELKAAFEGAAKVDSGRLETAVATFYGSSERWVTIIPLPGPFGELLAIRSDGSWWRGSATTSNLRELKLWLNQ